MVYIKLAEIRAIVPPILPHNVNFDITSEMIQLLNLKDVFFGAAIDYANIHIANFTGI